MWSLGDWRNVFMAVGLIGVIGLSLPGALVLVHLSGGERFSELYVLGPGHMAEGYPFNVTAGVDYRLFLGVGDHLGGSAYYQVVVKLRNATESLPNATSGFPSSLPALYSYEVFLADGMTWEEPLAFRFEDVGFEHAVHVSYVGRILVNDAWVNVDKSGVWDNVNNGYFYQLIIELWLYNATSSSFGFHNRFVCLWLNMTAHA
jgi:hypothetical protein